MSFLILMMVMIMVLIIYDDCDNIDNKLQVSTGRQTDRLTDRQTDRQTTTLSLQHCVRTVIVVNSVL